MWGDLKHRPNQEGTEWACFHRFPSGRVQSNSDLLRINVTNGASRSTAAAIALYIVTFVGHEASEQRGCYLLSTGAHVRVVHFLAVASVN